MRCALDHPIRYWVSSVKKIDLLLTKRFLIFFDFDLPITYLDCKAWTIEVSAQPRKHLVYKYSCGMLAKVLAGYLNLVICKGCFCRRSNHSKYKRRSQLNCILLFEKESKRNRAVIRVLFHISSSSKIATWFGIWIVWNVRYYAVLLCFYG